MRSPAEVPLPGRQEDDPLWFSCDTPTQDLKEVEVVLVQGVWPEMTDSIWLMKLLKLAVGTAADRTESVDVKQPRESFLRVGRWHTIII